MILSLIIFALVALFIITLKASWCLKHYKVIRNARKFPSLSGHVPVFGHLFLVLKYAYNNDAYSFLDSATKEFLSRGVSTGVLWLGPVPFFIICDPEDAKQVYGQCLDNSYVYSFVSPWIGQGLVSCTNLLTWKRHRNLLNYSFNQKVLNNFVAIFNRRSKELVKKLTVFPSGEFFDPESEISKHNMEVLSETVLGKNQIGVPLKEYRGMVEVMCDIVIKRTINIFYHLDFIYKGTQMYKEQTVLSTKLRAISKAILDSTIKARNEKSYEEKRSTETYKPFMDLLLDVRDRGLMDEREVQDELDTFIAAGYETVYSTLLITISVLGRFQEVQEKVYQEIVEVVGTSEEDIDPINLKQLTYLEAVIKEVLRLYPTIMINPRSLNHQIKLGGITTVTGEEAILNIYAMGRHKSWGPDADEFKPERWLKPNEPINPNLFTVFSLGRRDCIGKLFALMSLKTSTAQIVRKFKIFAPDEELKMHYNFTLKPISGNKIALESRL